MGKLENLVRIWHCTKSKTALFIIQICTIQGSPEWIINLKTYIPCLWIIKNLFTSTKTQKRSWLNRDKYWHAYNKGCDFKDRSICSLNFFGYNSCLVPKSKLLMKMYYKTHKFLTWVQNKGLSVHFKFWVQGKNESNFPQYFFNFLSIFW